MKHASHKATTVSRQKFSLAKALFASGKGSHSVRAVRAVQSAGSDAVVLGLDPAIAEKIMLERDLAHPIESVGKRLRARMSWLQAGAQDKAA